MGNQRQFIQVKPKMLGGVGVALRIRDTSAEFMRQFLADTREKGYYTYFVPEGQPIEIINMDSQNVNLGMSQGSHVVIQSGGKMFCGYENFINHIRDIAPHVEDALFYVLDEVDYMDEFKILDSKLHYARVSEGYWHTGADLIFYLDSKGILEIPDLTFQLNLKCFESLDEFVSKLHKALEEFGVVWNNNLMGENDDNLIELGKYETTDEFTYEIVVISKYKKANVRAFMRQVEFTNDLLWKLDDQECYQVEFNGDFEQFL